MEYDDHEQSWRAMRNVRGFRQLKEDLQMLFAQWYDGGESDEEMTKHLRPVLRAVQDLQNEWKDVQDEKSKKALLNKRREEIVEMCSLLQISLENHLSPTELAKVRSTTAAIDVLDATHQKLTELITERRCLFNDILAKRSRLVGELGDANNERGDSSIRPNHTFVIGTKTHDISSNTYKCLEMEISELQEVKADRKSAILRLSKEICQHLVNENIETTAIDLRVSEFLRTRDFAKIGLSADRVSQLVKRKEYLSAEEQHQKVYQEDIKKKLRLIDDRQALIGLIKNVEASAESPLRLFGDSQKLVKESQFRKTAYSRLLAMERILFPTLQDWVRSHGERFMYKGIDYLEAMEQDLKTRKLSSSFLHPNKEKTDFETVVEDTFSSIDVPDNDKTWGKPTPRVVLETLQEKEKRDLLKLGWCHPSELGVYTHISSKKPVSAQETMLPPKYNTKRQKCITNHYNGGSCSVKQDQPPTGTEALPASDPSVFKHDPHLLLPTPPKARAARVNLRKQQLLSLQQVKHKSSCQLDTAVSLKELREKIRQKQQDIVVPPPKKERKKKGAVRWVGDPAPYADAANTRGRDG
eukprot:TRINITY_DN24229_c0_g1_i1.p1 TRINITY_DN24229_c0_g1~~TRINITY_DN24229_c0_g1_i1.p1  ORF type:complete len:610 (+),score=158.10 TRINITY_DN24229_c0_g1_i1:82-1830(+)